MKPIFILGVGAQRAGTTFLHRFLNAQPGIRLSTPKELHVLDDHFISRHTRRGIPTRPNIQAAAERNAGPYTVGPERRQAMVLDLEEYRNYFRELTEEASWTGDLTPEYCMLSRQNYEEVRALLEPDFDVRVIFIMRDPIDRILSAQIRAHHSGNGDDVDHHALNQRFLSLHRNPGQIRRTRYETIVENLESAFGRQRCFFGFYEDLFRRQDFSGLMAFLDKEDYALPDLGRRVNRSGPAATLDRDSIRSARDFYDSTYRFCAERFGREYIAGIWPWYDTAR